MSSVYRRRRSIALVIIIILILSVLIAGLASSTKNIKADQQAIDFRPALERLDSLSVASKTSNQKYERSMFGSGWTTKDGCDTRNIILYRDLTDATISSDCLVMSGVLIDPYSSETINFKRGTTSSQVQIDHVVALSDAWLSGAENLPTETRVQFANDPLELLAVSAKQNQAKSGSDASKWLPPNKSYQCTYVARQIDIKAKYKLTLSSAEKDIMNKVLSGCNH